MSLSPAPTPMGAPQPALDGRPTAVVYCEANFGKCTVQDQIILNEYLRCLEATTPCTAGNENAAATSELGCASKLISGNTSALSPGCQSAFN